MIKIFIDGGARGNPGPAGIGVVVINPFRGHKKEYSCYIGEATNNQAEYQALVFGLKKAKALYGKKELVNRGVEVLSDSKLLIKQMKGEYKIEDPALQALFLKAWNLKVDISNVKFKHIPRAQNKKADQLLNQALDAETKKQALF